MYIEKAYVHNMWHSHLQSVADCKRIFLDGSEHYKRHLVHKGYLYIEACILSYYYHL